MQWSQGEEMEDDEMDLSFRIRERLIRAGHPDHSPSTDEFVKEWEGRMSLDDSNGENQDIGMFRVVYVDADSATNAGWPLEYVFDEHPNIDPYWAGLYDDDRLKGTIAGMHIYDEYGWSDNLLIIDWIMVLPQFRGRGLGLATLVGLINNFRMGAGLVAIQPRPLQFVYKCDDVEANAYKLDTLDKNEARATRKMQALYGKLGFARVANTPFMVLAPHANLPAVCDLMRQRKEARRRSRGKPREAGDSHPRVT